MKKCAACAASMAREKAERRFPTFAAKEYRKVCKRVRQQSPQWWEKTPGWVWNDVKGELARQSRRLSAHEGLTELDRAA